MWKPWKNKLLPMCVISIAATAPSHEDLSKMYQSIHQLGQTVHQLVGENRGQSDSLRLILSRLTGQAHPPIDTL